MMMKLFKGKIPLLLLLLIPGTAAPVFLHSDSITLPKALALVEGSDIYLQQLRNQLQRTRSGLPPQLKARFPVFYAEYEGNESCNYNTPYSLTHKLSGGIEVNLTDSGSSWFRSQDLKRQASQLDLEIRGRISQLTYDLISLCSHILYSKRVCRNNSEVLEMYTRHLHSVEQQFSNSTISAYAYRRLKIQYEGKKLKLAEERLNLQNMYTRLQLLLRTNDDSSLQLEESLPQTYTGIIGKTLSESPQFYKERAKKHSIDVSRIQLTLSGIIDQRTYKYRQLCPHAVVFGQVDFTGRSFPPAAPALSFGLRISGGGGPVGVSVDNTGSYSPYMYSQAPSTHIALDFTKTSGETIQRLTQKIRHTREELKEAREGAGAQAVRLFEELRTKKQIQRNINAQTNLSYKMYHIKKQEFEFGNARLIDVVESREAYDENILRLYQISRECLLIECSLLQHCGLSSYIPKLVLALSPEPRRPPKPTQKFQQKLPFQPKTPAGGIHEIP